MGSKVVNRPSPNGGRDAARADKAATKIQARFRGYRVRKQLRLAAQVKKQNGPKKTASAEHTGRREQPASDAQQQRQRSAVKIQAGVRGFLVRRRRRAQHRAAATIQASFRAFRARRQQTTEIIQAASETTTDTTALPPPATHAVQV